MAGFATGVIVLTVRDGRDDHGVTVSSFLSVSADPPTVLASLTTTSYLAEVLTRRDRWAATILSAGQRALAGRFAMSGRPGARVLLAAEPHHRGTASDALILDGGVAAFECATRDRVPAGDHTLFIADVLAIDPAPSAPAPLLRVNHRYVTPEPR
ncbi:4-hydroxyphenylacetate 3-monooxygenase reductase component [Actinomadura rubteroloni]|uniref:4-hydroxyphenylacetate 3-monooxygenase reductase component n=1 Tax=Actinomadura rubteroloni TaxID=1926885 RepID=A0A2P4UI06_9ACTN|nr:flavin reductase family protein [Actinomadura rubteroloni]POM24656.1 4-hydroxyphenylacetate 3-monooxygenase reductase component [Actinomadura rubteroloni]